LYETDTCAAAVAAYLNTRARHDEQQREQQYEYVEQHIELEQHVEQQFDIE
jgi:hypothetical protein